jgi:hypothetical protein
MWRATDAVYAGSATVPGAGNFSGGRGRWPAVDLVDFVRQRLDEKEQRARYRLGESAQYAAFEQEPEQALREAGAGRAIVALHRPGLWNADDDPADIHCAECTADEDLYKAQIWPCPTMRALAAVYDSHPDYQEAWKP